MLPVTTDIQNYLNSNSVRLLPHVSAEWNYNLTYSPYATYSGTGKGPSTTKLISPSSWTVTGKTSIVSSTAGKVTSTFTGKTALELLVLPTANAAGAVDLSDTTNFNGYASVNLSTGGSVNKCYKVVFLARSLDNNVVNLIVQGSSSGTQLSGGTSVELDNLDWQKVEFKIGQRPDDGNFTNINLTFDIVNSTLSSLGQWGILIDQIQVYEITYFDYLYGNLWDTDSPFHWFRPGESFVRSGNSSLPDSAVARTISSVPSGWNNSAPCSSLVYSPRILFSASPNPIYKNGVLSPFSQYKYFVSELPSGSTSIGATYQELLATNKIVLKFNVSQSIPDNIVVNISNSITNVTTAISVPSSWISSSGVCILYWNGSTWSNTKWSWTPTTTSGMPFIGSTGEIQVYSGGTLVNGYQYIDSISVTQLSSTPLNNYINVKTGNPSAYSELTRMQVIEVSPRLEVDLSAFVLEFDIKKELDNSNTPLPISSMSANSATVSFSNIPLIGPNNYPLSIFSNDANSSEYISPLQGMILKNMKIYLNYYLPDKNNYVIPSGVVYVDSWDNTDIKVAKANCYDIIKFLQTLPVADYVSESQSAINIFTNIMDLAGFTDYDYNGLLSVLTDNNQQVVTNYFFADNANKTVYQILQEAFLAFQVGCFIDEYGVMRFLNLNQIISNNIPSKNSDGTSLAIVDKDVVIDTYNENIKTKIGKILMRYRAPQIKRSIGLNSSTSTTSSILQVAPDIIWQQDAEDLVPFNVLQDDISSVSQNYYTTPQASFDNLFLTTVVGHKGYCVIEGEVMSYGDMEVLLSGQDTSGNAVPGASEIIYVKDQNDFTNKSAIFSNQYGLLNVDSIYTGRFVNVSRGLFGTTATTHTIMTNSNKEYSNRFYTRKLLPNSSTISPSTDPSIGAVINVPTLGSNIKTMVFANKQDQGYSTYSANFRLPDSSTDISGGIFFNCAGNSSLSGLTYFIEIKSSPKNNDASERVYNLYFYQIDSSGNVTSLLQSNYINVSAGINNFVTNEPDDDLYNGYLGGFINLKFVNNPGKRVIYVNKTRYDLDDTTTFKVGSKTTVSPKYFNNSTASSLPASFQNTNFGFFASTTSSSTTTVELSTVYATETPIDDVVYYYFQTREFLNALVAGYNVTEKSFFVQSRPHIFGINYYDVQLALTPSLGSEIFKANYLFTYYPNNDYTKPSLTMNVPDYALSYSNVASTGFRAKFAIANASTYSVYTKTGSDLKQLVDSALLISSRGVTVLTPQLTVEKVISPQNVNEVVELQSDWVQSAESADSILKLLSYSADAFSRDIIINVFGKPLIQVGDVLTLHYSLKNIGNPNDSLADITFFVQGVEHAWANGGVTTTLTLNQITYNGVTRESLGNYYPQTSYLAQLPKPLSVSPNNGSDLGGTSVTITGINFMPNSQVFFGSNVATNVTYVNSTTITATTPATSTPGMTSIHIISNGVEGSSAPIFKYTVPATQIQNISNLSVALGTQSGTTFAYPLNLTWNVSNTSGEQYNAFTLEVDGPISKYTYSQVSDTIKSQNSYTTPAIAYYGDQLNITITPLYIDSSGNINQGTAVTEVFDAYTVVSGPQTPTINPIPPSISGSTNGSITTYSVTFTYILGQNTTYTHGYTTNPSGGSATINATGDSNSITFPGINLTNSVTFYITGVGPGGESTAATYTLSPSSISSPTAPSTNMDNPVITNLTTSLQNGGSGTFSVEIEPPTGTLKPVQYTFQIQFSDSYYPITYGVASSTVLGSGNLKITSPLIDGIVGASYIVWVDGTDGTGLITKKSNTLTTTIGNPTINAIGISSGGYLDWTITNNSFTQITLNATALIGSASISDTIVKSGSNWLSSLNGSTISTDGVNFAYPASSNFTPGSFVTYTVSSPAGGSSTGNGSMPGTITNTVQDAPNIFYTYNGSTTTWTWQKDPMVGGATFVNYTWNLYSSYAFDSNQQPYGTVLYRSGTANLQSNGSYAVQTGYKNYLLVVYMQYTDAGSSTVKNGPSSYSFSSSV
jgi:hypothetical protein